MELISDFFTRLMVKYDVIEECNKNIYAYGIRALVQKILFTTVLFLSAFLIHEIMYTLVFYFSYIEIRGVYGRFHSKNRISCFCWTVLICFIAYFMKNMVLDHISIYIILALESILFLLLNFMKQRANPGYVLQARSVFLFTTSFIFYGLHFKTSSYGIFMAFFCTALLEFIHSLSAGFKEKKQKSLCT